MDTSHQSIVNSLAMLSGEQLREIRDKASALITIGPKRTKLEATAPEDAFTRDLYEAVTGELECRTQVKAVPFGIFVKTAAYRDHLAPAAALVATANSSWFPQQTRIQRASMLRLYAGLVVDYLAGQERPAVWYNLAAGLSVLPQIVDRAFPGYAAAGLLGKVQQLRTKGPG